MNKKTLFTSLIWLVLPVLASAQTIGSMAQAIAGQVIVVGTWIVVIMWVITGILFLSALGDPGKINTAKLALFSAVGGTILIILARGAQAFVANSFGL
jgi:hypothetical protein